MTKEQQNREAIEGRTASNSIIIRVSSIKALRDLANPEEELLYFLESWHEGHGYGEGFFRWDRNSAAPLDGGRTFSSKSSSKGRFLRLAQSNDVSVFDFGAYDYHEPQTLGDLITSDVSELQDIYGSIDDAELVTTSNQNINSVAFQAAIDFVHKNKGSSPLRRANVQVPSGRFLIAETVFLKDLVTVRGAGSKVTWVKLANESNTDMFLTENFNRLSHFRADKPLNIDGLATKDFGLFGMTLNGNAPNQELWSGLCCGIFGFGYDIQEVNFKGASLAGLVTEWDNRRASESLTGNTVDDFPNIDNVSFYSNRGTGWWHGGPNDAKIGQVKTAENGSGGCGEGACNVLKKGRGFVMSEGKKRLVGGDVHWHGAGVVQNIHSWANRGIGFWCNSWGQFEHVTTEANSDSNCYITSGDANEPTFIETLLIYKANRDGSSGDQFGAKLCGSDGGIGAGIIIGNLIARADETDLEPEPDNNLRALIYASAKVQIANLKVLGKELTNNAYGDYVGLEAQGDQVVIRGSIEGVRGPGRESIAFKFSNLQHSIIDLTIRHSDIFCERDEGNIIADDLGNSITLVGRVEDGDKGWTGDRPMYSQTTLADSEDGNEVMHSKYTIRYYDGNRSKWISNKRHISFALDAGEQSKPLVLGCPWDIVAHDLLCATHGPRHSYVKSINHSPHGGIRDEVTVVTEASPAGEYRLSLWLDSMG